MVDKKSRSRQCGRQGYARLVLPLLLAAGAGAIGHPSPEQTLPQFSVPGNRTWTATGLQVKKGEQIHVAETAGADGRFAQVQVQKGIEPFNHPGGTVTARGSYTLVTGDTGFPVPSFLDDARFPAYGLIGRIGETGRPFFIGREYRGAASASGELWLGINDPRPAKNKGRFLCTATVGATADPPTTWPMVVADTGVPRPVADATVVIFFVDGMRPDVLVEMAQMGHMPTFDRLFLSGGTWVRNSFTLLPSLTQTSFASMMTGKFSDKHGVKMQFYYDRRAGRCYDNLVTSAYPRVAGQIQARGIKTLYDYFPDSFAAGALPLQHRAPQVLEANLAEWLHRAVNVANFQSNIINDIDRTQAWFAREMAAFDHVRVLLVWLPETDHKDERWAHGQFGRVREQVARVDECLAMVRGQLELRGCLDKTYFVLFSDHGKAGGDGYVNKSFDVGREILQAHFRLNTRSFRDQLACPGTPRRRLSVLGDSDGAVEVFLPYGRADSGNLSHPNLLRDLERYPLADDRRVNALERFTEFTAGGRLSGEALLHKPVDFAVARVDDEIVFVQRTANSQALITRRRGADGELEFKYEPVRRYRTSGGRLERATSGDPLRYLDDPSFGRAVAQKGSTVKQWLEEFHPGREWLAVTAAAEYPGCVDALNRFFYYENGREGDKSLPDLLLFSSPGWVFLPYTTTVNRRQEIPGARHGMAFREATRNCLFFSGPNVRRGCVIDAPHRIVDILPTVLTMMSRDWRGNDLDGVPVEGIWNGQESNGR